jgi:hypothetical protein
MKVTLEISLLKKEFSILKQKTKNIYKNSSKSAIPLCFLAKE